VSMEERKTKKGIDIGYQFFRSFGIGIRLFKDNISPDVYFVIAVDVLFLSFQILFVEDELSQEKSK
jgi:hypothetical protein